MPSRSRRPPAVRAVTSRLVGAVAVQHHALRAVQHPAGAVALRRSSRHRRGRSATAARHARTRASACPRRSAGISAPAAASGAGAAQQPAAEHHRREDTARGSARGRTPPSRSSVSTAPPPKPPCASANGRPSRPSSAILRPHLGAEPSGSRAYFLRCSNCSGRRSADRRCPSAAAVRRSDRNPCPAVTPVTDPGSPWRRCCAGSRSSRRRSRPCGS